MDFGDVKAALQELQTAYGDGMKALEKRFTDRVDELELELRRPPAPGGEGSRNTKLQRDAFSLYIRKGREALTPEYMNALIVSDDTKGGFLAPAEFEAAVLKNIVLYSPIRALATVKQTSTGEVKIPKRTGTMSGAGNRCTDSADV